MSVSLKVLIAVGIVVAAGAGTYAVYARTTVAVHVTVPSQPVDNDAQAKSFNAPYVAPPKPQSW